MAYVSGQEGDGATEAWWHRPVGAWGPGQRLLACGAAVVAELRAAVRRELGYSCSAGGCTLSTATCSDIRVCPAYITTRGTEQICVRDSTMRQSLLGSPNAEYNSKFCMQPVQPMTHP
jgi:hypothetical protein